MRAAEMTTQLYLPSTNSTDAMGYCHCPPVAELCSGNSVATVPQSRLTSAGTKSAISASGPSAVVFKVRRLRSKCKRMSTHHTIYSNSSCVELNVSKRQSQHPAGLDAA